MSTPGEIDPQFEEVFGFRAPTDQELTKVVENMSYKLTNEGVDLLGMLALISIPGMSEATSSYIRQVSDIFAEKYDVPLVIVQKLVTAGFIGAAEFIATIRQQVDD